MTLGRENLTHLFTGYTKMNPRQQRTVKMCCPGCEHRITCPGSSCLEEALTRSSHGHLNPWGTPCSTRHSTWGHCGSAAAHIPSCISNFLCSPGWGCTFSHFCLFCAVPTAEAPLLMPVVELDWVLYKSTAGHAWRVVLLSWVHRCAP